MKNRTREICTSGTVRDEGGNILIYSANDREDRGNVGIIRSPVRASILPDPSRTLKGSPSGRTKLWRQVAFKAFSIHPIKWSGLIGLFRKQTAPAFMARARTLSSG
jgi:hypothetical protein